MMNESPSEILVQQIGAQEQLLWEGRPQQGIVLRSADFLLIPFSLLWCGFAIFWEATVLSSGAPLFFCLWGIPFLLLGMYLVVGRFWVDAILRSRTVYGVTSKRVIIVSGILNTHVKSLCLDTLADISLTENANGRGTIAFGASQYIQPWSAGTGWPSNGRIEAPTFELNRGAKEVYEMIHTAKRKSCSGN